MKSQAQTVSDEIVGPARIEPGHVRTRTFRNDAGQLSTKPAWRRLTPLQMAFDRGQLRSDDGGKFTPENRLAAGAEYGHLFDLAQESGRDSTVLDRVASSAKGTDFSDRRADAISKLAKIDVHMSVRDRKIVRMVCGEGHWPSEAVRHVCGSDYTKAVSPRFREALDALIEAISAAHDPRQSRGARFAL